MKKLIKMTAFVFMLLLPLAATAADTSTKGQDSKVEQTTPDVTKFDQQMAQAHKNMQIMQEQMSKINQTQDPQERQKLLKQHWSAMRDSMGMMRGMMGAMGCPMMGNHAMPDGMMMDDHMMSGKMMNGNMMGWHDMSGYYDKLTPEQMKQRQYMMDQYMGMQQMMMDNMMQHQDWMAKPPQ